MVFENILQSAVVYALIMLMLLFKVRRKINLDLSKPNVFIDKRGEKIKTGRLLQIFLQNIHDIATFLNAIFKS